MAYDGYHKLGETEIINTARTSAYVQGLMPNFGLKDCTDCEGLEQAAGAPDGGYTTPVLDNAPWVDSSNPALNDFWGLYPLDVAGIDDSTRTLTMTELTTDGGIASLPRRTSREIRYDVMLLGRTEASVTAGLHWLDRALEAYRCDGTVTQGCTGTELEFLSSCPPACDYSGCPDSVVPWEPGSPTRYNWVRNPTPDTFPTGQIPWEGVGAGTFSMDSGARMTWAAAPPAEAGVQYVQEDAFTPNPSPLVKSTNLATNPSAGVNFANWSVFNPTGETTSLAVVGGIGDGPEYLPSDEQFSYVRRSVLTVATTPSNSGTDYTQDGLGAMPIGTQVQAGVWVRSSTAIDIEFFLQSRQNGVATTMTTVAPVALPANTWVHYTVTGTTAIAANGLRLAIRIDNAMAIPVGHRLDTIGMTLERTDFTPHAYDGFTNAYQGESYRWTGAAHGSPSERYDPMGVGVIQYPGQEISARFVMFANQDFVMRGELRLTLDGVETGDVFTSGVLSGGTFHEVEISGVATSQFDGFILRGVVVNYVTIAAGDWFVVNSALVELTPTPGEWFSGDGGGPLGSTPYWMGTPSQSPSALIAEVDSTGEWTVSPASSGPGPQWDQWQSSACVAPWNLNISAFHPSNEDFTMTRVVSGLIPGSWYRIVTVAMTTADGPLTVQVRGEGDPTPLPYGPADVCGNTSTPTVLWFKARNPIAYIDYVSPSDGPTSPGDRSINVFRLDVQRSTPPDETYTTTFPDDGTQINGWNLGTLDVADGNIRVTRQNYPHPSGGYYPTVSITWAPGLGGKFPAGQYIISRAMRGLVVGKSYRVAVQFESSSINGITLPPVTYAIGMEDGPEVQEYVIPGDFSLGKVQAAFTFTATSTNQRLYIGLGQDYIVPGGTSAFGLSTTPKAVTVEPVDSEAPPLPDSAAAQRRTLYRTSALSGPTVVEKFDKTCGYMMRVQFGLVSGIPDQYTDVLPIGSAMGGTGYSIGNQDCVNGERIRTNWVRNPSFETNTSFWTSSVGTFSRVVDEGLAYSRTCLARVTGLAAQSGGQITYGSPGGLLAPGIRPGEGYIFSAYVRAVSASDIQARLAYVFRRGDTTIIDQEFASPWTILTDDWTRLVYPVTAPQNAEDADLVIQYGTVAGTNFPTATDWVGFDGVMLEYGIIEDTYFDGSFENATWVPPIPDNARSVWNAPDPFVVRDPDCPALPTPPSPPSIDACGVEVIDSWIRYAIDVPAEEIPRTSLAVPIVTITTLNSWSSQARLRWWPNPNGLDITQMDPCSFEFEMILSRVPSNSAMTIDGISRTSWVVKPDGRVAPTNHLLYGEAGGPVEWPELRCNQDYIFTVDVDRADYNYSMDVFLSLGLKV